MNQVAILQLIDSTSLTLDTPASLNLPQLATPLRIFDGVDDAGAAKYRTTSTEITVGMLLNQTAGFGQEFAEKVTAWKATLGPNDKGKGFVNSCKIVGLSFIPVMRALTRYPLIQDNLVHTPIVEEPGTLYMYGNNAESVPPVCFVIFITGADTSRNSRWLGLFIQNATGQSLEAYMQEHIFKPLGMSNTTFFPFDGEQATRLMPLRYWSDERNQYEVLTDQFPGLTLPRVCVRVINPVASRS